jgi:hypothetical protein
MAQHGHGTPRYPACLSVFGRTPPAVASSPTAPRAGPQQGQGAALLASKARRVFATALWGSSMVLSLFRDGEWGWCLAFPQVR